MMHPIDVTNEEMEVLQDARKNMDWSGCTTPKLMYIYQRLIALPAGRVDQVKEIAEFGKKYNKEHATEDEIFGNVVIKTYSTKDKSPERWYDQLKQRWINVTFKKVDREDKK